MILFPAIDLKDGLAVRLQQGDMARATVFNTDPADQAYAFELAGFEYLHIVDLDGAFAGKPVNGRAVDRILEATNIRVQLGGGIRDMATVEGWLDKGVNRVIIGTAAVRDPTLVREAAAAYPGRVAVGLDARDGKVAVQGWAEASELSALDIAQRFEDAGVSAIIYTDIARDGMLKGINWDATIALADAISIPVIASGGLASIDDVKTLLQPRADKLEGAIAGRALYDGRLNPAEALALIRAAKPRMTLPIMTFKVRIIPCLDVKDGRVVKGVNFVDLRDAGDPVEAAIAYDAAGADELTFLDITASHENRGTMLDVVRRTAEACFMPVTVGGGVRTVEDIRVLLQSGADKVSINTAAVERREFVKEAAEKFGDQCIVVAIDAKTVSGPGETDRWEIFTHGGRKADRYRCGGIRAGGGEPGCRRNPADLDGSRRHQAGLQHSAHARHRRCGDRCR